MRIALSTFLASLICVFVKNENFYLPGKIIVCATTKACFFYDNSDKIKFELKLRYDKEVRYSGLKWIHKVDNFVGVEGIKAENGGTTRSNVARFDINGNLIDRIYESQEDELVGSAYLSLSDNLLLFTSAIKSSDPLGGLSREQSIIVMDFNDKKVLMRMKDIALTNNLELCESPWLYDEDRFIYTIIGDRKIEIVGENYNPKVEKEPGIYMFNLRTNQHELLVRGGRFGVCSPVDLQVSYIKDKSIWILDVGNNTKRILYEAGSNERISHIHWTPNGKYIYLTYFEDQSLKRFRSGEKLIEVSGGKEISFNKIGQGFSYYSWK